MKRFISILLAGLALVSVSCKKEQGGDEPTPVVPSRFSLNVNIIDGRRTLDRMVDYAKVSVGLVSVNELESYTFKYQVEGGEERTVNNMYNGINRSLNADFREFTEYGGYRLTGYAYSDSNPELKVQIDTTVWMKYVTLESQAVTAIVKGGRTEMDSVHENYFAVGEGGTLELTYLPPDTHADIVCTSSDSGVLRVDSSKARMGKGLFTVPFVAVSEGTATLSYSFANGPDRWDMAFIVNVEEECEDPVLNLSLDCPELVLAPGELPLVMTSGTATGETLFNLEYYLDGTRVAEDKVVKLEQRTEKGFDISGLPVGKHEAKVVATYVTGESDPVSVSATFYVAKPGLEMGGVECKDGDELTMELGKSYVFVLQGVPDGFVGLFSVSGAEKDVISGGSGRWVLRPTAFGKGSIELSYAPDQETSKRILSLNVLRTDICKLSLSFDYEIIEEEGVRKADHAKLMLKVDTEKYAALEGLQFSGTVVYGGTGKCLVAGIDEETDALVNNEETRSTKDYTVAVPVVVFMEGSALFCDLSEVMDAILSDSFKTNVWKEGEDGVLIEEPEERTYQYDFRLLKVTLVPECSFEGLVFGISAEGLDEETEIAPGSDSVIIL